jgi:hypothetical protein
MCYHFYYHLAQDKKVLLVWSLVGFFAYNKPMPQRIAAAAGRVQDPAAL